MALRAGTDDYRRGDYEQADRHFQQALAAQQDLTPAERQDLATWLELNSTAMRGRQQGEGQLRQAELAARQGRTPDALSLYKAATINQQFLTASDRQQMQQLSEQLLHGATPQMPTGAMSDSATLAQARSKLKQARTLMSRGNLEAAQALARETDSLKVTYQAGEDTPQKVLADIAEQRALAVTPGDPKSLLLGARVALNRGDLDEAERLAHDAENSGGLLNTVGNLWRGDSPAKVLKDVQAARAHQLTLKGTLQAPPDASAMKSGAAKDGAIVTVSGTMSSNNTELARQYLREARQALRAGQVAQAKQLTEKAQALKPDIQWWEENTPDKLMAEIHKADGVTQVADTRSNNSDPAIPSDPHDAMKQARSLYEAGKLDESERIVLRINARGAHWGLFEDSPDRLLADIHKAKFKRDQEESVRVLADARAQYQQGNLGEAEKLAHRAQRLHGPYNLWDLGDRPQKLLAEIDAAKAKNRQNQVPPPAPVVMKEPEKPTTTSTAAVPPAPPTWPASAGQKAAPPVPAFAPDTTPRSPYAAVASAPQANTGKKLQAQDFLAQAHQLQRDGRLLEARQKVVEAQRLGATFGPDDDRPEVVLLALNSLCQKRVDALVQQADDYASAGEIDPSRYQRALWNLNQARQLAVGFGLDTHLIDSKLNAVEQMRARGNPTGAAPHTMVTQVQHQAIAPSNDGEARGKELLNQARMELRAGQTGNARRLAESAFEGPYGVQTEATQVLRSIDAEEFNQRLLTATRSFDAGVAALNRHEYPQAVSILRGIDSHMLPPDKQARLKELLLLPEMQPTYVAQVGMKMPLANPRPDVGHAQATDMAGHSTGQDSDFAQQVQAMQEIKFQKLRDDGLKAQSEATKRFQAGETDRALEVLKDYQSGLNHTDLDPEKVALLRRPVEARYEQLTMLKHQRDFEKMQVDQQNSSQNSIARARLADEEKKKQIVELMKQYKTFYKEGKYQDAEKYASLAHDLDPDDEVTGAAVYVAHLHANLDQYNKAKQHRDDVATNALNDAEDPGPVVSNDEPLKFDPKRSMENRGRKATEILGITRPKSEREQEIYRRLEAPITGMDYKDTPLKQILDDLQATNSINVVPDEPALNEAGISLDRPMTIKLEGIALKSALNVLLHQVHLTYVVQDEVLKITTEDHASGKLVMQTHPVLDLIIPVADADPDQTNPLAKYVSPQPNSNIHTAGATPWLGMGMQGGKDVSQSQSNNGNPVNNPVLTTSTPTWHKENPRATIEDQLIGLITSTIKPQSWSSVGGPGTIQYYPLGGALVINQTPDIQEQVAELLSALRRLQDQEVAIEVRFITIAESFFERIGLDFNINIRTHNSPQVQEQLVSQQFAPFGFINKFSPQNFISGLNPAGGLNTVPGGAPSNAFTQDLGIPISNTSFGMAVPPFGGFPNIPGGNGGLSMGLAFLSDIEVFMFMEAAQGDQRTNVMQAPKITMFNGQTSTLAVTDQQFFVFNVSVFQAGGQVVFVPSNAPVPTGGVTLTLNSVISADRRFVRMSITPALSNVTSANVPLFPITTFITPIFEGGAVGQPIPFTQFLQQPNFNTITVNTTVNVPDGGTVLLGGLKRLSEGRNEFGPPILSKIPYLNRLFKNVGYGRETESLMMMVTPRIIINEEEEIRQVGPQATGPGPAPGPGGP
jgi:type II secretory pathway component GspD/PulD (secretin)/tetratricopeptide (TPR) repeat protein